MRTNLDPVLLSVELAIRSAARAHHPIGIGLIPRDCFAQPALPCFARTPTEFAFYQSWIYGVPAIMPETISHKAKQGMGLSQNV
jgi:hypothetical protein